MDESELYAAIYKDELTGINNRKAFNETEYSTVAIVDLDSLKYLNDTYGHRVGNNYMIELVAVLRNIFGDDNVYRLGGDEFAVTGNTATDIRRKLEQAQLLFPGFTAGIGMTIADADDALMAAKEQREKCALVMLLAMGSLILLALFGVILYYLWKSFIFMSDELGAYLCGIWDNKKYLELTWFIIGLAVLAALSLLWEKGAVPFIFFWAVIYHFFIRRKPR